MTAVVGARDKLLTNADAGEIDGVGDLVIVVDDVERTETNPELGGAEGEFDGAGTGGMKIARAGV